MCYRLLARAHKRLFERLKELEVISLDSTSIDYYVERFDCHFASHDFLTGLERDSNNVIQLIDTTDFGMSLAKYADRWEPVLERQRD